MIGKDTISDCSNQYLTPFLCIILGQLLMSTSIRNQRAAARDAVKCYLSVEQNLQPAKPTKDRYMVLLRRASAG